jgi:uncharacterized membrane protein YjgN (DUF898 family)
LSDYDETVGKHGPATAFSFHGNWVDFMKIAAPNLLLTIVTLGIYRFWATTRERQYLWGQTEFIDERLEWTGIGMELFIGFLMAFFLIGIPFTLLQLVVQGLVFQGQPVIAVALGFVLFMLLFYLIGIAYFRALRYRLSRTYWRGIRGGSDDQGLGYGFSYLWKNIAGMLPIYLLYPWASISLWNERWSAMSFGPYRFVSTADWTKLMKRYLLFYLAPFLLFVMFVYIGYQESQGGGVGPGGAAAMGGIAVLLILALYIVLPVAALLYYSKFIRVAVGGLKLGELEFEFKARSPDWILFFLANWVIWGLAAGLAFVPISMLMAGGSFTPEMFQDNLSTAVIGTLILSGVLGMIAIGLANALIQYRSWKFFVVHMEAYGEVNLDRMSQSETVVSGHGEGLLDAFDVGAI